MMSRKHYVSVARVLRDTLESYADEPLVLSAVCGVTEDLGRVFKADNGNFDRQRFFDAVTDGTSAGRIIA